MELQLVAVVNTPNQISLLRIPLLQSVRSRLMENWISMYESFVNELERIEYSPGYSLGKNQCFMLVDFNLPNVMAKQNSQTVWSIEEISDNHGIHDTIQGTMAYTKNRSKQEIILFQDFASSNVIYPGRFLRLDGNEYRLTEHPGFLLDLQLSAVFLSDNQTLLFRDFRAVNSFLPLDEFYRKTSAQEIRELLNHESLIADDVDTWAKSANQWFRNRFTLLGKSGILDRFSVQELKARAHEYGITLETKDERIVFPSDKSSAKKLLRFLNEDYFKGAITGMLYQTRLKKPLNN